MPFFKSEVVNIVMSKRKCKIVKQKKTGYRRVKIIMKFLLNKKSMFSVFDVNKASVFRSKFVRKSLCKRSCICLLYVNMYVYIYVYVHIFINNKQKQCKL